MSLADFKELEQSSLVDSKLNWWTQPFASKLSVDPMNGRVPSTLDFHEMAIPNRGRIDQRRLQVPS